jgi:DNA-binding response OmpR family regulator
MANGRVLRVLVTDDNRDAADSLAKLLRLWGHEPQVAYDGPSALAQALAAPPHVAILDIGLANLDGWELGRRLRMTVAPNQTLLIAGTEHGREEDRHRSEEVGFDHHLTKPFDLAELRCLLEVRRAALVEGHRL